MFLILNYLLFLVMAAALLGAFYVVYTWITPQDEIELIRAGNLGAAFSLGGAMIGFTLTISSAITHNDTLLAATGWAVGALVVQVAAHAATSRLLGDAQARLEAGNVAAGAFMGAVSLCVGVVNAACLS